MPFALIIVGVFLLVASARNTQGDLFTLVKNDFIGPNNFVYWFVSILIIGSLGYIPKLRPLSNAFLLLVVIVLFLTKGNPNGIGGGFFSQFTKAIKSTTTATPTTNQTASTSTPGSFSIPALPVLPSLNV